MKIQSIAFVLAACAALLAPAAYAKGCLKGAAVGAVAGHVAGHHAVAGAVGGCIVGRHIANKKAAEDKAKSADRPAAGSGADKSDSQGKV